MTDSTKSSDSELTRILSLVWRRKWVMLVPFVSITTLVTLWGLYIPNLYRSSSSIFIEPQKVPTEYVRSTITSDMESRLRTIRQQLTNRTKLLKVIEELDLYPEVAESGAPSEVVVARMRKDLSVDSPGGRQQNFFTVSYNHRDPTKAMMAVTSLVSLFVEESLHVREQQAAGTTLFIGEELDALKIVLEEQEAAIQDYKKRHMGELPEQLDANLRMLDNLQLQLKDTLESQRTLGNRIVMLEQDVTRLEEQFRMPAGFSSDGGVTSNSSLAQLLVRRDVLSKDIAAMEARFTPRHPDLVRSRRELKTIEAMIKNAMSETLDTSARVTVTSPGSVASRELINFKRQLEDQKLELNSLKDEEEDLRGRLAVYQRRVEATPSREQQLLKLTRDYDNTKKNYEDLLNKKLEAQLSENLERRQKGEKFQILDPANLPEKPYLPNRPKILVLGFTGGLGVGMGLALLLEMMFPAFHSVAELKAQTDLPIIIGIPLLTSRGERQKQIRKWSVWLGCGALVFLMMLFAVNAFVVDLGAVAVRIGHNIRSMF